MRGVGSLGPQIKVTCIYTAILVGVLILVGVVIGISVALFDALAHVLTKTGATLFMIAFTYLVGRLICEACVFAASSPVVKQILLVNMNKNQAIGF